MIRVRRFSAILLVVAAVTIPAGRRVEATVYDYVAGHGDIGLSYDTVNDALRIYLNFDASTVVQDANGNQLSTVELNALQTPAGTGEWSMDDFRVVVPASQQFLREPGAAWDIVGVAAGAAYWELPEFGQSGVPFFGFERRPSNLANPTFTLGNVLLAPAGGVISAWQYQGDDPDLVTGRYWSTAPGSTPSPNAITLAQTHQHYNFGFSQPGLYRFEITGTTPAASQTAMGVLTVNVVPEPSGLAVIAAAAGWWLLRCRKKILFCQENSLGREGLDRPGQLRKSIACASAMQQARP